MMERIEKKTTLEKRAVLGLLALFVLTLIKGPLRTLPWFRHAVPAVKVQPAHGGELSSPLTHAIQSHLNKIDGATETAPRSSTGTKQYTAQQLRDPMKSLLPTIVPPAAVLPVIQKPVAATPPPAPAPTLHLQGLLWGNPTPKAIIDGEVYGVGDTIQDAKIVAIDHDGVTIEHHGKTSTYSMTTAAKDSEGFNKPQEAYWR